MTKIVFQKTISRFLLVASGLLISSHVWGQGYEGIWFIENQTEGIRLRQLSGSQSKDSLSVKTTSSYVISNNWGIGQTTEKFLKTKSGYTIDLQTQFIDFSYTTGETWTLTLGLGIPIQQFQQIWWVSPINEHGIGKITTGSNTEYISSNLSGEGSFAVFGFELSIFEFLVGHRETNIAYSTFESGSSELDAKYKVSGGQSMVGLGLSF